MTACDIIRSDNYANYTGWRPTISGDRTIISLSCDRPIIGHSTDRLTISLSAVSHIFIPYVGPMTAGLGQHSAGFVIYDHSIQPDIRLKGHKRTAYRSI